MIEVARGRPDNSGAVRPATIEALIAAAAAAEPTGRFSVWVGRSDGSPIVEHAADSVHCAASTIKLPVAIALLRAVAAGDLRLEQPVEVHAEFDSVVAGERFTVRRAEDDAALTWEHLGRRRPLGWLAEQMISWSSNLATNLVLELVDIPAAAAVLDELAGPPSALRRGIDDVAARTAGIANEMTAAAMAAMLCALAGGRTITLPPVQARILRDWLAGNGWNGEIPAGLPPGVRVEHKNGWDTGLRHDAGVIHPADADPFVVSVLTTSRLPDARLQRLIADIAAASWAARHDLARLR